VVASGSRVERRCPLRRVVVFTGARHHLQSRGWRGGGRDVAATTALLTPTRSGRWRSLHVGPGNGWDGGAMRLGSREILGRLA
jgi:hypothetical protein